MPIAAASVWARYMKQERQAAIPPRVQAYWRCLSATERQSVLFLDEADLVKQLYKLNFSLLCVGLVQRRLKKKKADEAGGSDEPTYELLEAMEFMDIGTGIMTVKNELVQDDKVDTLFALVQENLRGFLSHTYVLGDGDFQQLFFRDSEAISTWDEYQHLVAILLEQLILKSFVAYLERESLRQMEALLLEEDLATSSALTAPPVHKTKKKKKRKKAASATSTSSIPLPVAPLDDRIPQDTLHDTTLCAATLPPPVDVHTVVTGYDASPPASSPSSPAHAEPSISPTKARASRLNPKAVAFQPVSRPVVPLKRKFDAFIVHVTPDADDHDFGSDNDEVYERDTELDMHLSAIYQRTAAQFGWDFERQEALSPEWLHPEFLMTQRVVRYFSEPPCGMCMRGYCHVHRYNVAAPPSSYWHHPSPVREYNHHGFAPPHASIVS
ncbi:hypothetical protein SDRG_13922 [Saprolegnia diclina VS20]|uniref:Uncharacterized protein n=1 Tax=Saprolegnia diclina (strain VS20) TaxID=1156394 RepID=T0Q4M1_SAPDV|nr:hypothetical protein SDRG_13922 [Saprolegnia diclina VS20]EQC28375.1 hypothetical protein SDRG_13922 [Saprolegnia diclina VS20]|eukprot:XP_008618245.1 hypothetical protein SDRG_13922 [Saprolegnia diclina VS20]